MIPLLILPKPQSKVGKTIAIRIDLKILMVPTASIIKDGEICSYSTGMAYHSQEFNPSDISTEFNVCNTIEIWK